MIEKGDMVDIYGVMCLVTELDEKQFVLVPISANGNVQTKDGEEIVVKILKPACS